MTAQSAVLHADTGNCMNNAVGYELQLCSSIFCSASLVLSASFILADMWALEGKYFELVCSGVYMAMLQDIVLLNFAYCLNGT